MQVVAPKAWGSYPCSLGAETWTKQVVHVLVLVVVRAGDTLSTAGIQKEAKSGNPLGRHEAGS